MASVVMAILQVKPPLSIQAIRGFFKRKIEKGDGMPGDFTIGIIAVIIFLIILLLFQRRFKKITINEYEKGVKIHKGKMEVVGPGTYRYYAPSTHWEVFDMRQSFMQINGQELLSADQVSVKISLAVNYKITDPEDIMSNYEDYRGYLYTTIQLKLREVVSTIELDEILADRKNITARVKELLAGDKSLIGFSINAVELKDMMLSGEIKKAYAEVIKAKKEALVSLEKARGEMATLRSLANAAQMMKKNPELFKLRMIQMMESSTGNTFVIDTNQRIQEVTEEK
jgi:regulator of protease activity HflC (stomatin/prohibitin superfamily)